VNQGFTVHTSVAVVLDGQLIARIVTRPQEREALRSQTGMSFLYDSQIPMPAGGAGFAGRY